MNPVNTTVAIDPKIKKKAIAQAKKDQLSVSAIIRIFLTDYAEGRLEIGSRPVLTENGFTPEEAKNGINVSGPFKTMEEIRAHLNAQ